MLGEGKGIFFFNTQRLNHDHPLGNKERYIDDGNLNLGVY